jgi:hypothetical protein
VWTGTSFDTYNKVAFPPPAHWSGDVALAPGQGFFLKTPSAYTNVFVGQVMVKPGDSATNTLSAGVFNLSGSVIPFGGTLTNNGDGTLNLGDSLPAGSQIQVWDPTLNGGAGGFSTYNKVAFPPPAHWSGNPTLGISSGYFIKPPTGSDVDWVQTLPAN